MIRGAVVFAVTDDEAVSVPTMVKLYVPLAATPLGVEPAVDDPPPPPQPARPKPAAARRNTALQVATLRDRKHRSPTMSKLPNAKLATIWPLPKEPFGVPKKPAARASNFLPGAGISSAVAQAALLVSIVSVPVTALLPETVMVGVRKHAFAIAGVTEKPSVPVKPFCGVTVIVEVPELPSAIVTLVAVSVNALEPLPEPLPNAASKLLKSTEPKPVASSYPVPAGYSDAPAAEHNVVPARHSLLPLVMS